jgi:hypothetical protein
VPITAEQNRLSPIATNEPTSQILETVPYKPLPAVPLNEPTAAAAIETASPPAVYERPSLPISPLMDPNVIKAKERWVAQKARPSQNPEIFQQTLAKNPYARALATPLRRCQLTYSVLPSFFLQDFNLMAHPQTGSPWYVPRSLALAKKGKLSPSEEKIDSELELKEDTEPSSQTEQVGGEFTPVLGYTVYTLASQHALRAMQDPKGYGKKQTKKMKYIAKKQDIITPANGPPARFIPDRYRQSKSAARFLSIAGWRPDMHEFVLDLMRRRLVEDLVSVSNLKKGYMVGCSGWEDALAKPQVGAFLWTGGVGELEEGMDIPPEFATLDVTAGRKEEGKTKKVPVHNLRCVLGKEKLAELREKLPSGIFEREIVVLKRRQQTVNVEMQLWRLQGFLAEYRDLYRDLEERPIEDLEDDDEDGDNEEDDEDNDFEDSRDKGYKTRSG